MKLHIGGQQAREGWTVLDALPGPAVDVIGNCMNLSAFADGSCSEVYASHVLEHLGYKDELPIALKEINRVMEPGGKLMVAIPDLRMLCHMFVDERLSLEQKMHVTVMMYGGRDNDFDIHYGGYDAEIFAHHLMEHGFKDIVRVPGFGLFNDQSEVKFLGAPISLNLTAIKSAAI